VKAKKMFWLLRTDRDGHGEGGERMKKETRKRKLKASPKKRTSRGLERLIKA